jgi:glyoxylase-like metal-dependent hydrolase (beta-lactamase superfamily II)
VRLYAEGAVIRSKQGLFRAIPTPAAGRAVVMHELDALYLEVGDHQVTAASWYGSRLGACVVDRKLAGSEEEIRLGESTIRAVHIPGHSPGSVAYFATSAGLKMVFAQDVHGPLHPSLLSNAADYQASLQRLIDLDADVLRRALRHLQGKAGDRAFRSFVHGVGRARRLSSGPQRPQALDTHTRGR